MKRVIERWDGHLLPVLHMYDIFSKETEVSALASSMVVFDGGKHYAVDTIDVPIHTVH